MSDEAPPKSITIKQLFQELGDYLERTSPPHDVEAGLARLKRRIEEERMDQPSERPWQRRPFQPGEDVVLELGTTDSTQEATVSTVRRMRATGPVLAGLPGNIVRWRVNVQRPDGSWEEGEWRDGHPPVPLTPPKDAPESLLEYDLGSLTPPRFTVIGDSVRSYTNDEAAELFGWPRLETP